MSACGGGALDALKRGAHFGEGCSPVVALLGNNKLALFERGARTGGGRVSSIMHH